MQTQKFDFAATYTSISKYTDQGVDGFLPDVFGRVTTLDGDFVRLEEDIDYSRVINVATQTGNFVCADCTTAANGATVAFTGVPITVTYLKMEESFCLDELKQYWLGKGMPRGAAQEALPFEQQFVDMKAAFLATKLDTIFWQGSVLCGATFDGLITKAIANGAVGVTGSSWAISTAFSNGVLLTFDNMANAIDSTVIDEDLVLFVGRDIYRKYEQSIRNVNNFWLDPKDSEGYECKLHGFPNITLKGTAGLNGYNKALLARKGTIIWGTSLNPLDEPIKGQYDMVTDKFWMRYKVHLGSGLAFPAKAVYAS